MTRQYSLYDWIAVPLRRNPQDARPESFRIAKGAEPEVLHHVGTEAGWEARREVIFKRTNWHYGCVDELKDAQRRSGSSLGMVAVRSVDVVEVVDRPDEQRREHEAKLAGKKAGLDLFEKDFQKDLQFLPWRFRLHWTCKDIGCGGHSASVLDWGLSELARRNGPEVARSRLESLADRERHDLRLFMGNLKSRPSIFSIVGLWYPLKADLVQTSLFTPGAA